MPTNLSKVATERGIKYFLISFVDLFGILRSKLVPARAIAGMQKDGAGFAGFAAWLDMTPADSDMFSIPDPDSLIQLPWKPEVGWLAGDLVMDGNAVEASPRVALKQQIARAEIRGFRMKTGVECEYFLVSADGSSISDVNDIQEKPCYDQSALMRQYDVISEICDCMIDLGWGPYQNDHEDANGQFEMNWDYDDARDAMIISQYQRMTHYGIAGYGCVAAFARRLELNDKGVLPALRQELGAAPEERELARRYSEQ